MAASLKTMAPDCASSNLLFQVSYLELELQRTRDRFQCLKSERIAKLNKYHQEPKQMNWGLVGFTG